MLPNLENRTIAAPVIFGCAGYSLTEAERNFFSRSQPTGFILFGRNIQTPDQVRTLVAELRSLLHHDNPCVLIDQEGGRVARLAPPHWPKRPSFRDLARAENPEKAVDDHYRSIAQDLKALGLTHNCAPVLDLDIEGAHKGVMGDRTASPDPQIVADLGAIAIRAHLAEGVIPVMKHLPGHGAARYDSHERLPIIDLSLEDLTLHFLPFQANATSGAWGMTAHCVYPALDGRLPATHCPTLIQFIRERIGFKGPLLTDDINMGALGGSFKERARLSLDAGCDIVLHCSGKIGEMEDVMEGVRPNG